MKNNGKKQSESESNFNFCNPKNSLCKTLIDVENEMYISIRDYFEQRIKYLEKTIETTSIALEKRLESMNEFRAQLKDQSGTFITRDSYDARHQLLQVQVDSLRMNEANVAGKASQFSVNVVYLISILGTLVSIVSIVVTLLHKL